MRKKEEIRHGYMSNIQASKTSFLSRSKKLKIKLAQYLQEAGYTEACIKSTPLAKCTKYNEKKVEWR